jgi:DNA adenine methylase
MPARVMNLNKPASDDPGWLHYVEPYAGSLAVLLHIDPEGISEVVSDRNADLMAFWQVIQSDQDFPRFLRRMQATPFSEAAFNDAVVLPGDDLFNRACKFFIRCRFSLAGRMKGFTAMTRNRGRRGMNGEVSAWQTTVEGLPAVHKRLWRVGIVCGDALSIIQRQDGPRALFYLDPPYLHETRVTTSDYAHEMSVADHEALLALLTGIRGRFLLSGYRSDLYDRFAERYGWRRADKAIDCKASGAKLKSRRIESLWMNFAQD